MQKSQIRKAFRRVTQNLPMEHKMNITRGLNKQLATLLDRLDSEDKLSNRIVGSYLPLSGKEIVPPQILGYEYAYPRFIKK